MSYDPNYLEPEILAWTKKKIEEKFSTTGEKAMVLAEKALYQIEGHGGNNRNKNEIEKVLNVVVATWINLEK